MKLTLYPKNEGFSINSNITFPHSDNILKMELVASNAQDIEVVFQIGAGT